MTVTWTWTVAAGAVLLIVSAGVAVVAGRTISYAELQERPLHCASERSTGRSATTAAERDAAVVELLSRVELLSCDGCGVTTPRRSQSSPAGPTEVKPGTTLGWTHSIDEHYCPDCSDVRRQTWGY